MIVQPVFRFDLPQIFVSDHEWLTGTAHEIHLTLG